MGQWVMMSYGPTDLDGSRGSRITYGSRVSTYDPLTHGQLTDD